MIDDIDLDDAKVLYDGLKASLAIHGPLGEALAAKIGPMLDGAHSMDILVAMALILCFLEDTCEIEGADIPASFDCVRAYIRAAINASNGEGH